MIYALRLSGGEWEGFFSEIIAASTDRSKLETRKEAIQKRIDGFGLNKKVDYRDRQQSSLQMENVEKLSDLLESDYPEACIDDAPVRIEIVELLEV